MASVFTRRRFLKALGAATYLALSSTVGCAPLERTRKSRSLHTPKASPLRFPKVQPLPNASSTPPLEGAGAFRSRPNLSPPAVEVVKEAHHTAPGYIFIALKEGHGQHGLMIVDNLGEPVWFREVEFALDFKVQHYRGKPVLTWWEGKKLPRPSVGEWVILDRSCREITRVQPGNGYQGNQHEFLITSQDTALLTVYNSVHMDLSHLGGPVAARVIEGVAQELDIETGEVLFEWHSLDHVSLDESYHKPPYGTYLDYFHLNSIDVDHDENLLISARHTSTVYKVDRKSGEVIWRLGGKNSDFQMGSGTRTFQQHDARRQKDGTITIFDNGNAPKVHDQPRGIVVQLDEDKMTASLVHAYPPPEYGRQLFASAQGNMQVLPNGNVFIGWGGDEYTSEFSRDGKLLFHAHFPPSYESYRAFRFPWSAQPTDRPVAVAERFSEGAARVYASWNGATEVAAWQVLAGPRPGELESLGSVPRDGFETAMLVRTSDSYHVVRAEDRLGQTLGTTAPVKL